MNNTFDPFDELAAMFLTAPAAEKPGAAAPDNGNAAPKRRPLPPIEILIAGHLPVRGGLWLTPYADAVARDSGCTALIRLDNEESSLQVLGPPAEEPSLRAGQSLHDAIKQVAGVVDRWIIRATAGSDAAQLLGAGAEMITILSSADEAAVVAAYQLIKNFSQAAEQLQRSLPSMGLALVGVDHNGATAAIERLNRTTASFLGVEAKLTRCIPRIDTGIKSTRCLMFSGQPNPTLDELMTWIDQIRTAVAGRPDQTHAVAGKLYAERDAQVLTAEELLRAPPQPPTRPAHPFVSPPGMAPLPGMDPFRMPAPSPAASPMPAAPLHSAATAPSQWLPQVEFPARISSAPAIKLTPKPMIDVEPKGSARQIEPSCDGKPVALASHVQGLTALPFRSPGHERIEIAIDQHGGLHLLGREQNLRDLSVVESWARAHRELIALACPKHVIDHSRKAVCHVFTAEPASVADLHGGEIRLHVLAPVVVNGATGWYAAPLNAVAR